MASELFGVTEGYSGDDTLHLWAGMFMSDYVGEALLRYDNSGYIVYLEYGGRVLVDCPAPRTDDNYEEVDAALSAAINAHKNKGA